jgi:hypothetical protein
MGPGKITVFTTKPLAALLYNFDIAGAAVKPQHSNWLKTIAPVYLNPKARVYIAGLASRTGSDSFNFSLSQARAKNVENILQEVAGVAKRPLMDLRIALGEEVARLAGMADGIEDERYRGVYLRVGELPPPPTAVLRNRHVKRYVPRRTHVKILLEQKNGKIVPQDSIDRRADSWANVGNKLGGRLGLYDDIVKDDSKQIDEDWTVVSIEIKTTTDDNGGLVTLKWLDVDYEWGPYTGSRGLVEKGKVTSITADEMNEWLNHPFKAYLKK